MNALIAKVFVPPLYGQVSIADSETAHVPEWVTGDEAAVASPTALLVATRPDCAGDVVIKVYAGEGLGEGELVFGGQLQVPSGRLEFGSITASVREVVAIAHSAVNVRVWVDRTSGGEVVTVVMDQNDVSW